MVTINLRESLLSFKETESEKHKKEACLDQKEGWQRE